MKLIEKIKNWIIKKLGGFTKTEIEIYEEILKEETIRTNGFRNLYFDKCDQYTAEHEAYLAMLNCHDATAEAAQKAQGVTEAAKAIKAHCKAHDYCENCELADESGVCKLANSVPCNWEVE